MKNKRPLALYIGAVLAGLACLTLADQIQIPYSFSAGTPAVSTHVNDNFRTIADVVNGRLDGNNMKPESLTGRELAERSVGSSELDESVRFGDSSQEGRVDIVARSGVEKITMGLGGCPGDMGGSIWTMARGDSDRDVAVYIGVPSCSNPDGGLVSVSNSSGSPAVQLQADGDIYKTGNNGFIHPHPTDPSLQIVYMSLEGGERGTYFRGTTHLNNGFAEIVPPDHWRMVSSEEGITVQLTPRGPGCGLYVAEATREHIIVRDAGGSSVEFDYLVNGLRAGFEDHAVLEANTMFLPTHARWEEPLDRGNAPALIQNGILRPDGMVDAFLVQALRQALEGRPDATVAPQLPRAADRR